MSPLEDWIMVALFFAGVFATLSLFERSAKKKNR